MKCPYKPKKEKTSQTVMEYDENGNQTFYQEVKINQIEFTDCEEENCCAWQDGVCCYKN